MTTTADTEPTAYLGYPITARGRDFTVTTPEGVSARFTSMQTIRKWVRRHRKANQQEER